MLCGGSRIRTDGPLRIGSFQDFWNKPLSHTSNKNNVRLPPRYEPLFTNATCPHIHSSVVFYGNLAIQRAF